MKNKIKFFQGSIFKDKRGFLWTSWKKNKKYKLSFNHDKFSVSKKKVLRGLHYDKKSWKLVSCPYGKFFLVVINFDRKSKDYLKVYTMYLTHTKNVQVLIPPRFANGHLCISDYCVFHYKMSYNGSYPDVKSQKVIKWNDKRFKIKWPIKFKPILSKRDK
tara:strand:- start:9311 stop:9790 length:480 start_codon:yes stop_codon:yes gene_type:complete